MQKAEGEQPCQCLTSKVKVTAHPTVEPQLQSLSAKCLQVSGLL